MRTSWIDEVRSRARIDEIAGQYTELRSMGASLRGSCPLHGGENPNFSVLPARGTYRCFVCDEGGDVFKLVMDVEGLDFIGAAKHLAAMVGVDIPTYRPRTPTPEEVRRAGHQARVVSVADRYDAWGRLGIRRDTVDAWGLGESNGLLVVPVAERGEAPLGWRRYTFEEHGEAVRPVPAGMDPVGAEHARDLLFHPAHVSSFLRKDVLVMVDDPCAALALVDKGYSAVCARAERAGGALTSAQADHLAEMGVKQIAFLVPLGREPHTRRERQRELFATEVLLLERGIEPLLLVAPEDSSPSPLGPSRYETSWEWVGDLSDADAVRDLIARNDATFDLFHLRMVQVADAVRSRKLNREEAVAKLRPVLDAAHRSGDRVLYHAYMAWASRALGDNERWRLQRDLAKMGA